MTQQTLDTLHTAKAHSDKKEYPQKAKLMYQLMRKYPEEFTVDASEKGHPGVTHNPTGFRMHVPWAYIPGNVGAQVKSHSEFANSEQEPKQASFSDGSLWNDVNLDPTEAQQDAGNYKKGHICIHGLMISIENPKGSTRSGVSPEGKRWETVMAHHYGYIRQSEGADGDHLDCYIGPDPASEKIWVIDQVDPSTGEFDEAKVMLGFNSIGEAVKGYFDCYQKGWRGLGEITECSVEDLKAWIADGCDPDEFYSWSKQGQTKEAVIKKEDGKYKLYTKDGSRVLGTHATRQEAIAQEYAIQKSQEKSAAQQWTPSDTLRQQVWEAEHTGKGVKQYPPLPTKNTKLKAYQDPGVTTAPALPGGIRGNFTVGQEYPYETWNSSYNKALSDAYRVAQKRYPRLSELPEEAQNLLIQHTYNATSTPYNKLYQGLLSKDPAVIEKEYTLATDKFPGLAYRNEYYKHNYVQPLVKRWSKQSSPPAVVPKPAANTPTAAPPQVPSNLIPMDPGTIDINNPPDDWKQTLGPDNKMRTDYFKKAPATPTATPAPPQAMPKQSSQAPLTLQQALQSLDLDVMEAEQRKIIKKGPKSKRNKAIQTLGVIYGLRRNEVKPEELLITKVPVIPPRFRPFSAQGSTFIPGDANVLYKELMDMRQAYDQERSVFGDEGVGKSRGALYDAVKAVYGYGESTNEKSRHKGVSGFMQKILGKGGPKFGYVSRRLLGKTQDSVARGVITVNPDLDIDQIDIPRDMAWTMYAPYVQRRLVQAGMSPGDALRNVKERTEHAKRALDREVDERWVVYSRAPVWHKYGIISGKANLVDGDAIAVNPFVEAGLGSDHDGDQVNIHLPASDEALSEAKTKLRPSSMLFKTRSPDDIMPAPKQEQILGLHVAQQRVPKQTHYFPTEADAVKEIKSGRVPLSDDIQIGTNNS